VLNALDIPTLLALEAAFGRVSEDAAVRVIILTGAGDKALLPAVTSPISIAQRSCPLPGVAEIVHRVFRHIEVSDKPTIAAVNGFALGGGTELILATDIRIMADSARLGLPEITLGLFPGAGGTQRIIRQVPLCRAKEIMFAGEQLTAAEAVAIGLANRVVPKADLMTAAKTLAAKIAAKSPLVLKLLKRTLQSGADMPLPSALAHEQAMIGLVLDTADSKEGCSAFLEKRPATFTGTEHGRSVRPRHAEARSNHDRGPRRALGGGGRRALRQGRLRGRDRDRQSRQARSRRRAAAPCCCIWLRPATTSRSAR
jgi:enoyl-CoA hydratase